LTVLDAQSEPQAPLVLTEPETLPLEPDVELARSRVLPTVPLARFSAPLTGAVRSRGIFA